MKFLKHFLLLSLLFNWVLGKAQFLIDEEFNSGPPVAGWAFAGTVINNATASNSGKSVSSLNFQVTGDQATSPVWANGDMITFMLRGQTNPSATDNMQVEVFNGAWSTVANVKPHTTAFIAKISISTTVTRARFTYTKGAGGTTVMFDDFTVRQSGFCTSTPLRITMINADACGSGCEGRDEFFTFKNGNSTLLLSNFELSYPDANNSSVTWCGSAVNPCDNFIATNPAQVTSLNTLAGCSILLNPGASIPPNANVLVFNGNPQNTQTNLSGLCASGVQYYALFANNTNDCNGRFGNQNTSCVDCYRGFFIRDRGNGCADTNCYSVGSLSSYNGSSVGYASPGSGPTYISPGSATACNFVALPTRITSFYAVNTNKTTLIWEAEEDKDIAKYLVEKSDDGINFITLGEKTSQRSSAKSYYQYSVDSPEQNSNSYYRLAAVTNEGNELLSDIIFVPETNSKNYSITQSNETIYLKLSGVSNDINHIEIYNVYGEKILSDSFQGSNYSFSGRELKSQICFMNLFSSGAVFKEKIFVR